MQSARPTVNCEVDKFTRAPISKEPIALFFIIFKIASHQNK